MGKGFFPFSHVGIAAGLAARDESGRCMGKLKVVCSGVAFLAFLAVSVSPQTLSSAPDQAKLNGHLSELMKKALSGDPKAQLRMGLAFEFGQGVAKDLRKAMEWYHMAADSGDPVAQTDLGYFYETGVSGARNLEEAAKWYLRAAVSGFTRAKFNLGVLYLQGAGVQRSDEEGARWVGEAAEDGCPSAMVSMSYLYANGIGVHLDTQKAAAWNQKAAKKNDAKLCMGLNPKTLGAEASSASLGTARPAP
jgi:TPR repeat protein